MKILITGGTKLHVNEGWYLKQDLKVIPSQLALVKALRSLGHEVRQAPVYWGDDLSEFDQILVYIADIGSRVTWYIDGMLWAMSQPNAKILMDDWQIRKLFYRKTDKKVEGKWGQARNKYMWKTVNLPQSEKDKIDQAHWDWVTPEKPVLVPAFYGGDLEKLRYTMSESNQIFGYDPNPIIGEDLRRPEKVLAPNEKPKEWITASLNSTKRPRLHITRDPKLPVTILGGPRGRDWVFRLPEPEAVNFYATKWYNFMPSYDHAGSGWWRARPQQVADGLTVSVYENPQESAVYGPSWAKASEMTIEELEGMCIKELHDLAMAQKSEFYERHPIDSVGLDRSMATIEDFINV